MFGIPVTILIGLLAAFVAGWLQRRQWYRNSREEIRVREATEATKLISDIAQTVDKRIAAQRRFAQSHSAEDREKFRDKYLEAIAAYDGEFNSIRSRLLFYFKYEDVVEFENKIHAKLVNNGHQVEAFHGARSDTVSQRVILEGLSLISAKTYRLCARLSATIAKGKFGTLEKIDCWDDPSNEYVSVGTLARRLLNI